MRKIYLGMAATLASATFATAQDLSITGDPEAGESLFRMCTACHNVVDEAGEVLAGRPNVRTGPNLFGVAGRSAATVEGFRYSPGLQALGEMEFVWTEEHFAAYIADPTGFIRDQTGQDLRGSMAAQRFRGEEDAAHLFAYLASFAEQEQ